MVVVGHGVGSSGKLFFPPMVAFLGFQANDNHIRNLTSFLQTSSVLSFPNPLKMKKQTNPFGWVELPVTDLDRAEKFYKDLFGFKMDRQTPKMGYEMSWFPMDMESYGAGGMLMKGEHYTPSKDGPLVYFTAPGESMTAAMKKVESLNITILAPATSIGEHGFMSVIEDSEGNRIALHSMVE